MNSILLVKLNQRVVIEYDKSNRLPGVQRRFLDQMDADMDDGITINGESIKNPDHEQRLQYMAVTLVRAAMDNSESLKRACCAYLGSRHPQVSEILATTDQDEISLRIA